MSKTAESTTVNTEHIAAIDRETAILYAEAIAEGESVGYYHQYRYLVTLTEDGVFYAFLDCENDLRNFNSFLKNSIFLGLAGMVVVFLLILLFSGIAVKPFEKAYAGQKRFVTDASHELKTPLTVIRSAGEVIAMEHGDDEWTETISHQIDRLSALTDNELGDIFEKGERAQCSWELHSSTLLCFPEFAYRFFNIGRETGVHFCVGTDAHSLSALAPEGLAERLKEVLL